MTLRDTPLGPGPEFDAIREMLRRWGPRAAGIGDDAALLDIPPGQQLAVSTDSSVEDVHFRRGWLTPREIGYRATVAALSDLAAMAATPTGLVSALAVPNAWEPALHEITDGIGEAAAAFHALIVGGNITGGTQLSLTITVLGTVATPLLRSAVTAGDTIYVTGALGASAAALRALLGGKQPAPAHRARFARPVPRLVEARWLAGNGAAAGIDVSDGLMAEVAHLAAASGVRISIDESAVPVAAGASLDDALGGGEEYELVVAGRRIDTAAFEAENGLMLTPIGISRAVEPGGEPGVDVSARVARRGGHDHLSS
jgi:thiamine-monophosphate kinase